MLSADVAVDLALFHVGRLLLVHEPNYIYSINVISLIVLTLQRECFRPCAQIEISGYHLTRDHMETRFENLSSLVSTLHS